MNKLTLSEPIHEDAPTRDAIHLRVTQNLGLARAAARRCLFVFGPIAEADDLTQEASLALVRAARHYDPRQGVRFSTYAYRCCWRACAALLRSSLRRRLADADSAKCASHLHGVDPVGSAPAPLERLELSAMGGEVLTDGEREILVARFQDGLTLAEVGRRRGVGPERIRQMQVKALSKLAQAAELAAAGRGTPLSISALRASCVQT